MRKLRKNEGFTLAELLIVVAIIAVLVAVSIPIFTDMNITPPDFRLCFRFARKQSQCSSVRRRRLAQHQMPSNGSPAIQSSMLQTVTFMFCLPAADVLQESYMLFFLMPPLRLPGFFSTSVI